MTEYTLPTGGTNPKKTFALSIRDAQLPELLSALTASLGTLTGVEAEVERLTTERDDLVREQGTPSEPDESELSDTDKAIQQYVLAVSDAFRLPEVAAAIRDGMHVDLPARLLGTDEQPLASFTGAQRARIAQGALTMQVGYLYAAEEDLQEAFASEERVAEARAEATRRIESLQRELDGTTDRVTAAQHGVVDVLDQFEMLVGMLAQGEVRLKQEVLTQVWHAERRVGREPSIGAVHSSEPVSAMPTVPFAAPIITAAGTGTTVPDALREETVEPGDQG